jgi:hypothetical protein
MRLRAHSNDLNDFNRLLVLCGGFEGQLCLSSLDVVADACESRACDRELTVFSANTAANVAWIDRIDDEAPSAIREYF